MRRRGRAPTARLPRRIEAAALLAPVDPVVRHRPGVERLFDFGHRLEFCVPVSQRRYGYHVTTFLLGDELVARVHVKALPAAALGRAA